LSGLTSARKSASLNAPWTRSISNQGLSKLAVRGRRMEQEEGNSPKKKGENEEEKRKEKKGTYH
jgi:hypothetical protein